NIIVRTDDGKPVEGATVVLKKSSDSSLYKSNLTDVAGAIEFNNVPLGKYLASSTGAGYEQPDVVVVDVSSETEVIAQITMKPSAKQMQEVTVTAKKPYIQKLHDRLVVNVENSIVNAGSTAFEVLERAPGVNIDQNDQIALRGKQGVIIMIDGRPSVLAGADLANYLRSIPSSAI
ncbi:MAG: TonB-dependent receptor, partial [Chitinophagaceae bacterium]